MTIEIKNRNACLFAYYEKNNLYKSNLLHFLNHGILDNVDYYIIVNGKCSLKIEPRPNLIVITRPNQGYDFGAWADCIMNHISQPYEYYIFLNSSVYGPSRKDWLTPFLELFHSPDTKLVGVSINVYLDEYYNFLRHYHKLKSIYRHEGPFTHVQSFFFILQHDGLQFLKERDFFNGDVIKHYGFQDVIDYKEIGMSQLLLGNDWNINCILSKYRDKDYREIKHNFNESAKCGDPFFEGCYFGQTIDPEEAIFYKNNR